MDAPFIDVRALASGRGAGVIYRRYAVLQAVYYAVLFGVPGYLAAVRGLGPGAVGVMMVAVYGVGVLAGAAGGSAVDRLGPRRTLLIGFAATTAGVAALISLDGTTAVPLIALAPGVLGLGTRLSGVTLEVALVRVVPAAEVGAASGVLQTARYTGTIVATGVLALVFGERLDAAETRTPAAVLTVVCELMLLAALRPPRGDRAGSPV